MPIVGTGPIDGGASIIKALGLARPCESCEAALDGKCYVRAEHQPVTTEFVADGVWINQVEIRGIGIALPQHSHAHSHATCLTKGSVRIERDDAPPQEYCAPAVVIIPAQVKHLFITLTDDVILLCVHNVLRTGAVEVIEEHQLVG